MIAKPRRQNVKKQAKAHGDLGSNLNSNGSRFSVLNIEEMESPTEDTRLETTDPAGDMDMDDCLTTGKSRDSPETQRQLSHAHVMNSSKKIAKAPIQMSTLAASGGKSEVAPSHHTSEPARMVNVVVREARMEELRGKKKPIIAPTKAAIKVKTTEKTNRPKEKSWQQSSPIAKGGKADYPLAHTGQPLINHTPHTQKRVGKNASTTGSNVRLVEPSTRSQLNS
ncbi:unnamed protein product [Linum trigynum]|uniref:Uncharacterized protein n=1 Tax=Linum trigynum TaxID=586398 RepID=A0AAV2FDR2_9ROSI